MRIDVRQAVKDLDKELKDKLSKDQLNLAMARAMNRTIGKARTLVGREIRRKYKMKLADLNGKFVIDKASRNQLSASLKGSTRTLTIGRFVTNIESWRAGSDPRFEVEIMRGGTKSLPKGLFVNPKNGLIFGKGKYSGGRFVADRGVISPIKTVSPYASAVNQEVQNQFSPDLNDFYVKRLLHEVKFLIGKMESESAD